MASGKPGGSGKYDYTYGPLAPLTQETETTYGGTKPGKAPTQKTPPAPDPFMLIEEQARVNRANEIGPSGTTINYQDPRTGVWTQKRSFSEPLQGLYNKQIDLLKNPLSTDFSADSDKVEKATYDRQRGLLDPMFGQRETDMRTSLANKGIMEGSEAWNREIGDFNRARDESYNKAALDSITAGRAEQGRLFGQGLEGRQAQFNELAALLGGQQVARPNSLDVMGPFNTQYQGQLQSTRDANANAASRNAQTTSAAATGASALVSLLAMSSEAMKENKEPIEHTETLAKVSDLAVEKWTYKQGITGETDSHIGPYAEQFRELFGVGDGVHINMVDAVGVCLSAIKALNAKIDKLEAECLS